MLFFYNIWQGNWDLTVLFGRADFTIIDHSADL